MFIFVSKAQIKEFKNAVNESQTRVGWACFSHLSEVFTVVIYRPPYQSMFPPLSVCHRYWDQLSSEPNNHQSGGEHGEDCATLDSHAKTWFDVPCEHIYKRICQMDVIQLDWIPILLKRLQNTRLWKRKKMNGFRITENKSQTKRLFLWHIFVFFTDGMVSEMVVFWKSQ